MEQFGNLNNLDSSIKLAQGVNDSFNKNMRALDKKHQENEEYKEKLLATTMELNEIRATVDRLKTSVDEFNESSNKISRRMLGLTIAIAVLTVIYTVVAIVQLVKVS